MLICVVVLEMARPGTPKELLSRWKSQREKGDSLSPDPSGYLRTWKGNTKSRDWERLEAFKIRDGWRLFSHDREFRDGGQSGEMKDKVNFGQTMPQVPGV